MNCTAWNSVRANALDEQAERHPEDRVRDREGDDQHGRRPRRRGRAGRSDAARRASPAPRRASAKASAVADEQVELRERQRHQPLERARRALAQHRDRGDEEHRDRAGRARASARRRVWNTCRPVGRRAALIRIMQRRTARRGAARSSVGRAAAGGARARRRARAASAHGSPSLGLARRARRNASSSSAAPGPRAQDSRASPARGARPSRSSRSASQRSASSITWLETSSVVPAAASSCEEAPEVAAEHRVEADGRLVEHEQLGLAERAPSRARRAPAGRRRGDRRRGSRSLREADDARSTSASRLAGAPRTRREVAQVLARP